MPLLVETPALASLFAMAREVARGADTPVLVCGERGSGAEDLARFIHDQASGPGRRSCEVVRGRGRGLMHEDLADAPSSVRREIPPLRAQVDGILSRAEALVRARARVVGQGSDALSPEAQRMSRARPYSGNLRELEAVVERAVIRETTETLTGSDVAKAAGAPAAARARRSAT